MQMLVVESFRASQLLVCRLVCSGIKIRVSEVSIENIYGMSVALHFC